jgi:hypothetical protein
MISAQQLSIVMSDGFVEHDHTSMNTKFTKSGNIQIGSCFTTLRKPWCSNANITKYGIKGSIVYKD